MAQIAFTLMVLSQCLIALQQQRHGLGNKIRILLLHLAERLDGQLVAPHLLFDFRLQQAGANRFLVSDQGLLEAFQGGLYIALLPPGLRLLTIKMGNQNTHPWTAIALKALCRVDGLAPLLFLLINIQQPFQRLLLVQPLLDEFQKKRLRPPQHAGAQIILPQLQQGACTLILAQRGAGDEILVYANGAVALATAAKKISQRKMGLHRLAVDFQHLHKDIDGLILLLIEQIIEPLEIARGKGLAVFFRPPLIVLSNPPTGQKGGRQKEKQQCQFQTQCLSFRGNERRFSNSFSATFKRCRKRMASRFSPSTMPMQAKTPSKAPTARETATTIDSGAVIVPK